jgi:hypothetical protein
VRVPVLKLQAFIGSLISTEAILIIGLAVYNSMNVMSAHTFRKFCIFVCFEVIMEFFDLSRLL